MKKMLLHVICAFCIIIPAYADIKQTMQSSMEKGKQKIKTAQKFLSPAIPDEIKQPYLQCKQQHCKDIAHYDFRACMMQHCSSQLTAYDKAIGSKLLKVIAYTLGVELAVVLAILGGTVGGMRYIQNQDLAHINRLGDEFDLTDEEKVMLVKLKSSGRLEVTENITIRDEFLKAASKLLYGKPNQMNAILNRHITIRPLEWAKNPLHERQG